MEFNYIDLIILLVVLFFLYEGIRYGFIVILVDFVAFFGSLLIALFGYRFVSDFLKDQFSLNPSISKALGFLITAILAESALGIIFGAVVRKLPKKLKQSKTNRVLSVFPALGEALVICAFVLILLLSFPIKPKIKKDISRSLIGGKIVTNTQGIEARLSVIFGDVIKDSLTYLTVNPESSERVILQALPENLKEDSQSELDLFKALNNERESRGIKELIWEPKLVPVARSHGFDMWEKRYFGHISFEGEDVGDRVRDADINYQIVGENLALAPTVEIAHSGLMNSEGHRANILERAFEKVGIGVVDNGFYGKIFVQVFLK